MDTAQHGRPKNIKWLALGVGLALGLLFIFSDFSLLLRDTACSRHQEQEAELTFAPSSTSPSPSPSPTSATATATATATAATAATASGQRRVVRASSAYPLDVQTRTSPCQLAATLRQVLFIRTCGPLTPELRASYAKYASELRASPHYDLWLLYDVGTEAPAATADEELAEYYALQREHPELGLFLYNASDVKAMLPTAAYIQTDQTPNFWFHDGSLFLWSITCRPDLWRSPPLPPSKESELYYWTVEHDAIYFGDVSVFLDEHNANTADYIADYFPLFKNWFHWQQSTWRPPYDKAIFKKQHAERHSTALLRYLYSITLLDVVAYGEIFASTVCALQPHWCVMAPLERRFIGPAYDWNAFLTDEQVAAMWVDPAQQGKWNHAVLSRKGRKCRSSLGDLRITPSPSPKTK